MSWVVARRYARALLDLGVDRGTYRRYGAELAQVLDVLSRVPMLKAALLNPSFSSRSRTELLQGTLGGRGLSREVVNFLCLLVERGRLQGLAEIVEHYQEMMDEAEGRVRASVCSAIPLDNGEVARIKTVLEETLGKEVLLATEVDPGLIGGVTVSVRNMVIDGSIRTRLRRLAETLRKG